MIHRTAFFLASLLLVAGVLSYRSMSRVSQANVVEPQAVVMEQSEGRDEKVSQPLNKAAASRTDDPDLAPVAVQISASDVVEPDLVEPDVVEQTYREARAHVDAGRFQEARLLALRMKQEHPDSPRTRDLEKHLLVNPLGLPSREAQMARID